jgi:hypothetical protein
MCAGIDDVKKKKLHKQVQSSSSGGSGGDGDGDGDADTDIEYQKKRYEFIPSIMNELGIECDYSKKKIKEVVIRVVRDILGYKNAIYTNIVDMFLAQIAVAESNTEVSLFTNTQIDQRDTQGILGYSSSASPHNVDPQGILHSVKSPMGPFTTSVGLGHTTQDSVHAGTSSQRSDQSNTTIYTFNSESSDQINFTHTSFRLLHSGIKEFIQQNGNMNMKGPYPFLPDRSDDEYTEIADISTVIDFNMPPEVESMGGGKRIRNEEVNTSLKYKNVNTSLRKHHVKKHNNTKTKAIKNVPKHKTIKKYKKKYSNNNTIKRGNRYNG